MAPRVFPTGKCFCGCGEPTEGTSFFVPGHDKKAEAKVIKEIYGGVVELLTAHGYGPEGRDATAELKGSDATGLQLLEEWSKESQTHIELEVLSANDRGGPRVRSGPFHLKYDPKERAFRFKKCRDRSPLGALVFELTVPLPDIHWVYIERETRHREEAKVVRLHGAISGEGRDVRFVPFG